MAKLDTIDNKNNCISDLVDRHAKNDQLKHLFFGSSKLLDLVFQVPIVSTALLIFVSSFQSKKKIDHLTDMMQSLALSIRTL